MAETEQQALQTGAGLQKVGESNVTQQKRKSEDGSQEHSVSKKMMIVSDSEGKQKELGKSTTGAIKMNLSGNSPKAGLSMAIGKPKKPGVAPIKISLSTTTKTKEPAPFVPKTKQVASVFNESDSDEEEMPAEAKMRMRNVGRETPTGAGPNSFGKGSLGFCDRTKMIERELKKQMDDFVEKQGSKG